MLPGPFASQVLADMGCEVTRIELPRFGDLTKEVPPKIDGVGFAYWMVNQGKKEVTLDFRKPEGLKKLLEMVKESDVVLEGFRPGLMDRVGLGFEALQKIRPGLVFASITGYDRRGEWGRRAGHDLNFLAVSGFLGVGNSEGKVAFPGCQMADLSGSMAAVIGILGALLETRLAGGEPKGRHISISMADTIHSLLTLPLGYMEATKKEPGLGVTWWSGGHPFYRLYETQDRRHIAVAAVEAGFAIALLDELGLSSWKDRLPGINDDHDGGLIKEMEAVFRGKTMAHWEAKLKDKDVCVTPVYSLKESVAVLEQSRRPIPKRHRRPTPDRK